MDSDSSEFSWIVENGNKIRNPEFPNNYISHIKENIGKYEFIFVSSHEEVREALIKNELYFYLVYPSIEDKELYLSRYKHRGSPDGFINLISNNWNEWLYQLSTEVDNVYRIQLNGDEYISNKIDEIIRDETFNLKFLNTPDKYNTEYGYLNVIMNSTCIDRALFGKRILYTHLSIANNIVNITKALLDKCDTIDDLKVILDNIEHEIIELNERNNSLSEHDELWNR